MRIKPLFINLNQQGKEGEAWEKGRGKKEDVRQQGAGRRTPLTRKKGSHE